ncbi:LamG domain-containing protein [Pseudoalteromonas sp.]|uniref:LamG domain-containing protein n=1 Tax=Pseudoalteromonas sp. TaxID=53249 RepID=UPI0026291F04|nr:LamG domain-containing protein [Pseudoalteromonas sp.]MCP4585315.1 LamG domain-containing protein [Pseudoalteromonas sp.]
MKKYILILLFILMPVTVWAWGIITFTGGGSSSSGEDWTKDADLVALWNLEDGALITDSRSTNTLTNNDTVTSSADEMQGDYSGAFDETNDECLSITDANLHSNFPTKSGGSANITVCAWVKIDSGAAVTNQTIISKFGYTPLELKSWWINAWHSSQGVITFELIIGYNSGASHEGVEHATTGVLNVWYYVAFSIDNSDNYRIRIWDDNASAILGVDKTGTFTNSMSIVAGEVVVGGAYDDSGYDRTMDGLIDSVKVFKRVLTPDEIDATRNETYNP